MAEIGLVVKIGGRLLAHPGQLDATLAALDAAAAVRPLLIVPGGGPFADAVREVGRRFTLNDDAAHWMAILGMDQYAHFLAGAMTRAVLVTSRDELATADARNHGAAVLAPYRWLREADPLPHSWSVTSDSIAAWVAGEVGALKLVLVKPPGADQNTAVDSYFPRAVPKGVRTVVVQADRTDALREALDCSTR
jgi:aspartokinase-like uncharacterized kinase